MEYNRPSITGKTSVYCVIGDPVDHSMSPLIQNVAFHSIGIDAVYVALQVKESALGRAIQGFRAVGVKGFNITAPHKVRAIQYLDAADDRAAEIGSVNTVINKNGELLGYNTDGLGAMKALEEGDTRVEGRSVLLLGAGGASRAIAHILAPQVKSIVLVNRTVEKANQIMKRLRGKFKIEITAAALSKDLRKFIEGADIIINASSMGMDGKADPRIEESWLRREQTVFDIVYKPVETKLLRAAKQAGARTVTGLDMLVSQGACSFELWTGRDAPIHEMRRAIAQHLPAVTHAASS